MLLLQCLLLYDSTNLTHPKHVQLEQALHVLWSKQMPQVVNRCCQLSADVSVQLAYTALLQKL